MRVSANTSNAPSSALHALPEASTSASRAHVETEPALVIVDVGRGKPVNIPPALINELNGLAKDDPTRSPLRATMKILMNYDGKYPPSCVERMPDPTPPANGNECAQFKFLSKGPKDAHHFYCEFKDGEITSISVRKESGESMGDLPAQPSSVAGKLPPGGPVRSGTFRQQALMAQLPASSKRSADDAAGADPLPKRPARELKPLPPVLTDEQVREGAEADYDATIADWERFQRNPVRGKVLPDAAEKVGRSTLKQIFASNAEQYEHYKRAVIDGEERGLFNNVSRSFVLNRLRTVADFVSHLSREAGVDAKADADKLAESTQPYRERAYGRQSNEWNAVEDFMRWLQTGAITEPTRARRI